MLFPDSDDVGIDRDLDYATIKPQLIGIGIDIRISTTIMFLDYATIKPQLIGINIQARAVQNTKQSLLSSLPSDIYHDHVQVLEQSHEHLKVPRDLGYLPGA
ncbi:hypothetical protein ACHAXR_006193 [Thalassiosira sp. AJA248-18]